MHCVVTAGPTYETMDNVRRLTNFSTGRLGTELANALVDRGHHVILLIGEQTTHGGERRAQVVKHFSTTESLHQRLRELSGGRVEAVFHAAAVSDFKFGKIWVRSPEGELTEVRSAKLSTRQGTLLAELIPTPKIISGLRALFPTAKLAGWKYEVDGDRAAVLRKALQQVVETHTNACIANGPAYGPGFGLVTDNKPWVHFDGAAVLFEALSEWLQA